VAFLVHYPLVLEGELLPVPWHL
jgi:hypothetical protein